MQAFLVDAGYEVVLAPDGAQGIELFRQTGPDLVLLDLMLPGIDGFEVCRRLRQDSATPIIMVTARDDDASQLAGFESLADDYITKPFSMPLVLKRVEAVLRRTLGPDGPEVIRYKDLQVDTVSRDVRIRGGRVALTVREYDILRLFLGNQGRVLTRDMILGQVWQWGFAGDERIINTHIKNIRHKLDADYIDTIRGVGYRLDKED
jgi:two-component system response regulator VanR